MTKKLHNPKAYAPAVYIPCWLIQVPIKQLSHGAKILYGRLAQWSNVDGTVYRSSSCLKEEMGTSLRTIGDLLQELRKVGLIGTYQKEKGGVNNYEFYDHPWMHEPINDHLSYNNDPMQNPAIPHAESCNTPMQNPATLNRKKIKRNKNKHKNISASDEALDLSYTESDEQEGEKQKSDYQLNQYESEKNDAQLTEREINSTKSDYFENQIINQQVSKLNSQYGFKNLQEENIFHIPEQLLQDWITNRKRKRAPITKTAWNKINKELAKCKEHGIEPIDAFEKMVAHGWQALDAEWFFKEKKDSGTSQWDVDAVMRA